MKDESAISFKGNLIRIVHKINKEGGEDAAGGNFGPLDISFFIRQSGEQFSRFGDDRSALAFESRAPLSFAELRERSWRFAHGLLELGVRPGDRVGVALVNSIDYWALYFAVTRIGAIIVRVNFRLRGEELAFILQDSECTAVVADPEILSELADRRAVLGVTHFFSSEEEPGESWYRGLGALRASQRDEPETPRPSPADPAMIMYTSGTTGTPKGVVWTHSNTTWWAAMQQIEWGFDENSITMATGPMYHIGALENYVLPTLSAGGTVVVFGSRGFQLERALDVARDQGVTDMLLFPSMLQELARMKIEDLRGLERLRRIFTGGDTVSPWVVERLGEVLPRVELTQVYGLTEGTPIAVSSPHGLTREHPELVGRPYPFTEVSIRDDTGAELPLGETGEIWTRSPAGSPGYWKRPEENARTFVEGWCRTGDRGLVEGGYLRFAGRQKDVVRSGGENISPAEIENVLRQHPQVADVAVIGIPHPTLVEAVCAVVVRDSGSSLRRDEVIDYCSSRLAGYKKPRAVMFIDELPRTPSQKVQKFVLRDLVDAADLPVS